MIHNWTFFHRHLLKHLCRLLKHWSNRISSSSPLKLFLLRRLQICLLLLLRSHLQRSKTSQVRLRCTSDFTTHQTIITIILLLSSLRTFLHCSHRRDPIRARKCFMLNHKSSQQSKGIKYHILQWILRLQIHWLSRMSKNSQLFLQCKRINQRSISPLLLCRLLRALLINSHSNYWSCKLLINQIPS